MQLKDTDFSDKLKFSKGGEDLYDAVRLQTKVLDNGEIEYTLKVEFGFEIWMYTSCDLLAIYPQMKPQSSQSYEFLWYREYGSALDCVYNSRDENKYRVSFSCVDLGTIENRHHYYKQVPITIGLNPDWLDLSGQTVGGVPIESTTFNYRIKRVEVIDYEEKEVGVYDDEVQKPNEEDTWVDIDVDVLGDDASVNEGYKYVADQNLGAIKTTTFTGPAFTELIDSSQKGQSYSNPTQQGSWTFNDWVDLRPRVDITYQHIKVRSTWLKWNNFHTWWYEVGQVEESDSNFDDDIEPLVRYAHVSNYAIHKDYKVIALFTCNLKISDYEKYSSVLDDPIFTQGDWIWTAHKGGTDEVTFVQEPNPIEQFLQEFLGDIFGIIIVVLILVGVGVALYFGFQFYMKKKMFDALTK